MVDGSITPLLRAGFCIGPLLRAGFCMGELCPYSVRASAMGRDLFALVHWISGIDPGLGAAKQSVGIRVAFLV